MTKTARPADDDDLRNVKEVLGTLISWMAQSSASPISPKEATDLLMKLNKQ